MERSAPPREAVREQPNRESSETIHEGRIVHLSNDVVRFPDGSTGELEFIRHRGASAVLPVFGDASDPDPEILLLKQFRYAAGGLIYEVPAGIPDSPDEPWEDCARRELEEEAGLRAGVLLYLTKIYTTPGFTNEVIHLFLASQLEEGNTKRDADEFIEVIRMPFSGALSLVREGQIVDAKTVSTLLYAALFVIGHPPRRNKY